jgi:hypothetical protein
MGRFVGQEQTPGTIGVASVLPSLHRGEEIRRKSNVFLLRMGRFACRSEEDCVFEKQYGVHEVADGECEYH